VLKIETLERKLAMDGEQLEEVKQTIERLKEEWLPPLRALLQRIDAAFGVYFQQIAISGEVSLAEHEDFDKYGVQIKVQFRPQQPAQVLDSRTQSGGVRTRPEKYIERSTHFHIHCIVNKRLFLCWLKERSVSTMLYLMALQDMTHCPFRLVDEINQGMDPTNERLIFEQFSRSASKPNQPQYDSSFCLVYYLDKSLIDVFFFLLLIGFL
jgi:chromosome segregation ATPase